MPRAGKRDQYAKARKRSFDAAKVGAESLRKRKLSCTPYSISKELRRLHAADPTVRTVAANTIRNNELCHELLSPEADALLKARGQPIPKEFQRLSREQAVLQLMKERAWAAQSSEQVMQLGKEVARLRLAKT